MAYTGHPDWAIEREGGHRFPQTRPPSREQLKALEAALARAQKNTEKECVK